MRYKLLGRSGLRVSELALGTMTFGEDWGWGASNSICRQIFDHYVDSGGNFIDTSNNYTNGTAERIVGELIAADRDHFVVATKFTLSDRRDDPGFSGNHRKNMIRSLEGSLRRLNTGYVDLFYLHAWDFTAGIEEVMRGLDDLVRSGKVLHVGISDAPAWIVSRANTIAEFRGWSPFVALQIRYSLIDRAAERDLLPMARQLDLAVLPWSILGAGVLTGKYNRQESAEGRASRWDLSDRELAIAGEVVKVATEAGCSPAQVALNWVRQQPGVIIPLVGATKLTQLKDNLEALNTPLAAEHLERLSEASQIDLGFPHDFLASDEVRGLVFGGTYKKIDNHRQTWMNRR